MFFKGQLVEVLPGYSMETHSRSIWDEIAGCEGTVVKEDGDYLLLTFRGPLALEGEVHVNRRRIKPPRCG